MFTYVHSHTTDTWPAVPLGLVLVVGTTGLQDGLVNTTASSNHTFNRQGRAGQSVHWYNHTVQFTDVKLTACNYAALALQIELKAGQ